ncbi:MAG: hypothetical protein IJM35_02405 [Bacteroidales bacterium]|nr:hypothetical protein [Bacteroidales bacterium]
MRRFLVLIAAALFIAPHVAGAQEGLVLDTVAFRLPEVVTDEYLDTVNVRKKFMLNDYCMVGAWGGVVLNNTFFNPTRETTFFLNYPVWGVSFTMYGKMFGFMPYFGFEAGFQHTYEGYKFKKNKETGAIGHVEGATKAVMPVLEAQYLSVFHFEIGNYFKIQAKAGIYGGYRMGITRSGDESQIDESILTSFKDTDRRFTYGFEGGAGFGLVFSPVEIHFNALAKWSWASFYNPDYYSPYYYRFAYPLDIMVTMGVYFQLTRRYGATHKQLRQKAKSLVYE